eukprot:GEMP01110097.1.p1 GENE.GEMP01110097.1~~GEMP01110097.1.p1  ORF type:complete len:157 (+),score=22.69 GEMP01110097.1:40-510(+)
MLMAELRVVKRALRTEIAAKLKDVLDLDAQSEAIQRHLIATNAYKRSKRLGIYLAMHGSSEVRTSMVVEDALRCGKQVFVPRVLDKENMGLCLDTFLPSLFLCGAKTREVDIYMFIQAQKYAIVKKMSPLFLVSDSSFDGGSTACRRVSRLCSDDV